MLPRVHFAGGVELSMYCPGLSFVLLWSGFEEEK
jgi:hypothetical protein